MPLSRRDFSLTRVLILLLCMIPTVYFTANPWTVQMITPDTWGYQLFSSTRDVLYPYILLLVRTLFGSDIFIIYIQLWIRCLATALLGIAVLSRTQKPLYALAMTIAVLANPFNYQIDAMIMTDSFFCSGITLFFAALLMFDKTRSLRWLVALGLIAGITTAIRPIGITLLPLLVFMVWLYKPVFKGHWKCGLAYLLVPLILVLGASKAEHVRLHGTDPFLLKHSLMLGKAGIMDAPPPENLTYPEIAKDLHEAMKPKHADLKSEKDLLEYFNKTRDYEVYVQFHYSNDLIVKTAQDLNIPFHHIMNTMGKEYIKAYPHLYLKDALIHYLGTWVVFDESALSILQHIVRYGIYLVGALTFIFTLGGLFRLVNKGADQFPDSFKVSWLAALYLQGYALFIGLFGVFVSRYTSCVTPVMCVALGLPLLHIAEIAFKKVWHKDQAAHG